MSEYSYRELEKQAQDKMDQKTKPIGSLGVLESIATRLAAITGSLTPTISSKRMLVYAASHGIASEGVSAYPAEVTGQMVLNFMGGGAAINVLTQTHHIDLKVIDVGVDFDFPDDTKSHPSFVCKPVQPGTRSFLDEPAMDNNACHKAIEIGKEQLLLAKEESVDLIGIGEMGIGNTSSAAALYAALLDLPVKDVVGPGTGLDQKGIDHKINILEKALSYHKPSTETPERWLAAVGGFEIAAMVGTILEASEQRIPIVVDGFIATAAAMVAFLMEPKTRDVCFFAHCSKETAHRKILNILGVDPILDLDMRLGEGTGAALAMPVIESAANVLTHMATFTSAGVSESESDVHKRV
jgi:nicotinate-nucleotide--dimethylbenzimidazole phosphoribosyltransferase